MSNNMVDKIASAACIPEEGKFAELDDDPRSFHITAEERERLARLIFENNVQEVHP